MPPVPLGVDEGHNLAFVRVHGLDLVFGAQQAGGLAAGAGSLRAEDGVEEEVAGGVSGDGEGGEDAEDVEYVEDVAAVEVVEAQARRAAELVTLLNGRKRGQCTKVGRESLLYGCSYTGSERLYFIRPGQSPPGKFREFFKRLKRDGKLRERWARKTSFCGRESCHRGGHLGRTFSLFFGKCSRSSGQKSKSFSSRCFSSSAASSSAISLSRSAKAFRLYSFMA